MQINTELYILTYGYDAVWSRRFKGMYTSKVGLETHAFKYVSKNSESILNAKTTKKDMGFPC